MPLKSPLFSEFTLKQESIFDIGELYKQLFRWFELTGYNFYECEYKDSDDPSGKRVEVSWLAQKGMDAYVMFVIEVSFLVTGMQKIDIEKGGVKIKTHKATIEFKISSYLLKDFDSKWSNAPWKRQMRYIYDRFLIRERLDRLESELAKETTMLIDDIKAFLDIHRF